MAPSISIESVISDLKSDKIKTREQGVADLKSYLSDQTHLRSAIDKGEGDPKYWLGIYQALFACVVEERKIVIKKGVDKCESPRAKEGEEERGREGRSDLLSSSVLSFLPPSIASTGSRLRRFCLLVLIVIR